MIRYEFNQKQEILEIWFEGEITLSELDDFGDQINQRERFSGDLKVLIDSSDGFYQFSTDQLPVVMDMLKKTLKVLNSIRMAVIQINPTETAFSLVLQKTLTLESIQQKVFSSREAALVWLMEKSNASQDLDNFFLFR